ncbi:hypothetical protein JCM31598_39630 [Desulfonatronum parangueonense]
MASAVITMIVKGRPVCRVGVNRACKTLNVSGNDALSLALFLEIPSRAPTCLRIVAILQKRREARSTPRQAAGRIAAIIAAGSRMYINVQNMHFFAQVCDGDGAAV